ncbi:MAG: hypothetical protein IKW53_04405 [Clostridia bacterium]|nr:hypothetical protein [Clostridia bacterium]
MFGNKKGQIMRHPYATLTIIGLAAVGVISISEKVKCFCSGKSRAITSMMNGMSGSSHMMDNE